MTTKGKVDLLYASRLIDLKRRLLYMKTRSFFVSYAP